MFKMLMESAVHIITFRNVSLGDSDIVTASQVLTDEFMYHISITPVPLSYVVSSNPEGSKCHF